jgi:hypothetical protein
MVGAGVLSLPSAMSWLGWVGGLLSLLLFYGISLWCSLMLTAVYKVNGRRHPTYSDAVLAVLGRRSSRVLVVVQRVMLLLAAIGYQIAAADSLTYIANSGCDAAAAKGQGCGVKHWQMTLGFGGELGAVVFCPVGAGGLASRNVKTAVRNRDAGSAQWSAAASGRGARSTEAHTRHLARPSRPSTVRISTVCDRPALYCQLMPIQQACRCCSASYQTWSLSGWCQQ